MPATNNYTIINQQNLELLKTCLYLIDENKNSVNGYLAKESWFVESGYENQLQQILEATKDLPDESWNLAQKTWAFFHLPIRYCKHCGVNPTKKKKDDWSDYCSAKCAQQSSERKTKISKSMKAFSQQTRDEIAIKKKRTFVENRLKDKTNLSDLEIEEQLSSLLKQQFAGQGFSENQKQFFFDRESFFKEYVTNKKSATQIAKEYDVTVATVMNYVRRYDLPINKSFLTSSIEKEIFDFIHDELEFVDVELSRRGLFEERPKQEIDVWVPSKNFGIEVNGIFWHSVDSDEDDEDAKIKHREKTESARAAGIRLVHLTDIQWIEKKDVCKSMISNILGRNEVRIFARKCRISKIEDHDIVKAFVEKNHIQGIGGSYSIAYALMYEDRIVSLMTFRTPRFNKDYQWEMIRFCSLLNHSIIGGFSRLLNHFIKENDPTSIISYADYSRSYGEVYEKNGFDLLKKTDPGYVWTNKRKIYARYQTQKHRLEKLLGEDHFDKYLSESQNMFLNGFRKLYDCGQLVYVWKNSKKDHDEMKSNPISL